jgi:hypothetical protein
VVVAAVDEPDRDVDRGERALDVELGHRRERGLHDLERDAARKHVVDRRA